ncbi:hypothetical protein [Streptomyces sp. NRRL F-2580]|uniref:hypothetical protein n=1 Tax=Streptomyces sp. NRRL F-2580 TaxID=1463841 RepID=UPI0004C819FB|nr:hypothetical protein [Streptomyces sp. NRRL F-2580]
MNPRQDGLRAVSADCFTACTTHAHEDLEQAVRALSGTDADAQTAGVRSLIRIARQDTAHRRQALAAIEEFVAAYQGRAGAPTAPKPFRMRVPSQRQSSIT